MSDSPHRLPREITPDHYDLYLEPDLETWTFDGHVSITIGVIEETTEITLNCAEIAMKSAVLRSETGETSIVDISYDEEYERATLTLEEPAGPGTYSLNVSYSGIINDRLRGLYRSSFKNTDGSEHAIAASQCQTTDARRIFPCWDEPDFKATFQTTMVVAPGLEAYSNAAETGRHTYDDGRVEITFDRTMRMSTYLLAFIVGPFEATEPVLVKGTPTRIIVPKGNLHLADVAMENASFCFEYLSDYYGIPYPADKLDHIGIPDFAAGAMENVGLITYRDAYVVVDPQKASQAERQNSIDVIGHEIAHQWFGNLVTMKWWEGAWLNEAFASFMEFKATDAMRPDWKRWLSFAAGWVAWAMRTDQLATTRPIEFEVNSPAEVDEMFDSITYGKGSAVLWMIEQFIGVEQFRQGVANYLRKHEYANTVTTDLWEGLDGASDWPVGKIMDTWVYQRGFPQIDVKVVDGGIHLSQRRYLIIPDETDSTIWKVPIQLRGMSDGKPFRIKHLLEEDDVTVEVPGEIQYVTANAGGVGFYRTRYSDDLFAALLGALDELDDIERYTLVSDTWAFVKSGQAPASDFLDLVGVYGDEEEQAIWSIIIGGLASIEHHALAEEARPSFEVFVRDLVGPALDGLGWEAAAGDSDLTKKLRGDLVATLGNLGRDEATIEKARGIAQDLLAGESLDPEVSTAALAVFAKQGGKAEYKALWNAYQRSTTPLDQIRFLRAVAAVETSETVVSTIDKIVEGDIRSQDGFWVFGRVLSGHAGTTAWEDARQRWDRVLDAMPGMTRIRVVEGVPALSQPEVAKDVRAFFAENPIPEAARAVTQKLELLDANVMMRERETATVSSYFGV